MTSQKDNLPLSGLRVLDFAQFLAGPAAALRLADLGAEVIKIERPEGGDLCRTLAVNDQYYEGNSLLFHTFNRNKKSITADLKNPDDLERIKALIKTADVMIHNFRPGVMERIGLDYEAVQALNPRIIYGAVSGYGKAGPWARKPGQDLLVQALSGMCWLNGNADDDPVPIGLALLDITTGMNLAQGILALLVRRGVTQQGGQVEVELLSSAIDLQYEQLTAYLNDGLRAPSRSKVSNANIYGAAPYGIYATRDGFLALAMVPLSVLAKLLVCPELDNYSQGEAFSHRDTIKPIIAAKMVEKTNDEWLAILEPADIWCAPVLDWAELCASEGFKSLDMLQRVASGDGEPITTTRCPIRLDGKVPKSGIAAPALGADNAAIFGFLSVS